LAWHLRTGYTLEFGPVGSVLGGTSLFELSISLLGITITLLVLLYIVLNARNLAPPRSAQPSRWDRFTVESLAHLEAEIQDLRRVVVICDHVEPPEHRLAGAVEANFGRGVKYLFLVSQSRAKHELNGYFKIFQALAEIHLARSSTDSKLNDLVEIQQLPYDWDDFPYVFYQTEQTSGLRTVAFRGDQLREGIAENYSRVDPRYAHTIARSVLADSPRPIRDEVPVSIAQFSAEPPKLQLVK
jgi:hypothetical protein